MQLEIFVICCIAVRPFVGWNEQEHNCESAPQSVQLIEPVTQLLGEMYMCVNERDEGCRLSQTKARWFMMHLGLIGHAAYFSRSSKDADIAADTSEKLYTILADTDS